MGQEKHIEKKILVVYYSQSGQLFEILKNIISQISSPDIQIDYYQISTKPDFPFPWDKVSFFDAFPESFLQIPREIVPPPKEILGTNYDLIILGYQVWFLSPSIPVNSFLKSKYAQNLFAHTPVVTVSGSRNMWIMAQEKIKQRLAVLQSKLMGNIALVDRHINHISVITIVKWMFSGEKKSYMGILPKPGVSEADIKASKRFGLPIKNALLYDNFEELQNKLYELGAVKIKPFLILTDKRANLLFKPWANFVRKKGGAGNPKRQKRLKLFNYYLIIAIWVFMPIVFVIFLLVYLPRYKAIKKEIAYYSSTRLKND